MHEQLWHNRGTPVVPGGWLTVTFPVTVRPPASRLAATIATLQASHSRWCSRIYAASLSRPTSAARRSTAASASGTEGNATASCKHA